MKKAICFLIIISLVIQGGNNMAYARTKKLTDANYSPTIAASESAIRSQVDGSIQEVLDIVETNYASITESKLDKTGNFTGTWHGLTPTQAEPGLSAMVEAHLAESVQSPRTFGAHSITEPGYENFDSTQAFIDMFAAFPNGIKVECKPDDVFIVNGVTLSMSNIDIDFKGATIKKVSGTGYIFNFGGTLTQKNIRIKNVTLEGDNTVIANGGLAFATDNTISAIDGLTLENITCKNFAQYGINIGSVSNFSYKNIKILNHGSTHAEATIGVGFIMYPKNAQKNGFIEGLYSEINPLSTLTSAAIKLQCISGLQAVNIHGVNGTESCISISATDDSQYKNIIIESTYATGYLGLTISSNDLNVTPNITDASFGIDNVKAIGIFTSEISLSSHNVKNVELQNVDLITSATSGRRIVIATNGTVENCKFKNIKAGIRFDLYAGATANNCEFDDITIEYGQSFTVTGNDNIVNNVKSKDSGVIRLTGNNNKLNNCTSINCTTNAYQLAGDNNILENSQAINPTGRNLYISSGNGNRYRNLLSIGGIGILDNGTGTIGLQKGTTLQRPTLAASDIGYLFLDTTLDADGKPIWWNGTAWVDATGASV
jgi:hypothetical protein